MKGFEKNPSSFLPRPQEYLSTVTSKLQFPSMLNTADWKRVRDLPVNQVRDFPDHVKEGMCIL